MMLWKCCTQCVCKFGKLSSEWSAAAAAKSLQSCPTLCDPIDGSPSGSPIPGILQARTVEWVAISFSNAREVAQSCPTPSDPMDRSLPGSSVHGIFQARVLEWGAIAFSKWEITGLEKVSFHSNPKDRQCQRMLKLSHNCTHLTRW